MTEQEDNALTIFCRIVAELNDAQEAVNEMLKSSDAVTALHAGLLGGWLETLRGGESQEGLNELVMEIIAQEDPQYA